MVGMDWGWLSILARVCSTPALVIRGLSRGQSGNGVLAMEEDLVGNKTSKRRKEERLRILGVK
jgi:hypothetical protein